jgi:hypothetical protein
MNRPVVVDWWCACSFLSRTQTCLDRKATYMHDERQRFSFLEVTLKDQKIQMLNAERALLTD